MTTTRGRIDICPSFQSSNMKLPTSNKLLFRKDRLQAKQLFHSSIGVDTATPHSHLPESGGSNRSSNNGNNSNSTYTTSTGSNHVEQQSSEEASATSVIAVEDEVVYGAEDTTTAQQEHQQVLGSTDDDVITTGTNNEEVEKNELLRKNIFNAILLGLSFGYAAYTIFNIDHGMTRGWTQSEIAIRIPLDNWLNYENALNDRPIVTKTAINVIIYLLGDWLSQTAFTGNHILNFNAARTLRNGFIGLCFGPLVHEYYQFSDMILPVDGSMFVRLQKIIMDQTIYLSVKCSIYIAAVGLLQGESFESVQESVKNKLPNIVLTAWKFWPLIHLVTYGVIPARHRILWVNCVDLIWNAILASMSQKKTAMIDATTIQEGEEAVKEVLLDRPILSSSSSSSTLQQEVPLSQPPLLVLEAVSAPTIAPIVSTPQRQPLPPAGTSRIIYETDDKN